MATKLDDQLAYIGNFVCQKEYRGRGIGKALFSYVLGGLQARTIILDSLINRTSFYAQFGFRLSDTLTFGVSVQTVTTKHTDVAHDLDLDLLPVTGDNIGRILQYDQTICSIDRLDHIPDWIMSDCSYALGAFQDGHCVGYICARFDDRVNIYRIQPLYADSCDIAKCLLGTLLHSPYIQPNCKLAFASLLDNRDESVALAEMVGTTEYPTFKAVRMVLKQNIHLLTKNIFAVTNQHNTII